MPSHLDPSSSSATLSSRASSIPSDQRHLGRHSDHHTSSHLHPEDAFSYQSPPRHYPRSSSPLGRSDTIKPSSGSRSDARKRSRDHGRSGRSGSRRRNPESSVNGKGAWKKLLWVKQSYPDNYTDEETFLDHLQRNPRLRPYEFWQLVADSTIIVQHISSVIIFVCCFTAISKERISPQTLVGWATLCTVAGWVLRDYWRSCEEAEQSEHGIQGLNETNVVGNDDNATTISTPETEADFGMPFKEPSVALASNGPSRTHSRNPSVGSTGGNVASSPSILLGMPYGEAALSSAAVNVPPYSTESSPFSPRMQERLTTVKSAILIYCSLLGLSPILKSLTLSTSSDSIWALSSWLMGINVFTFDYGAGAEAKFPASLSTNAALMASTVLASRLPSTTHVFSLTLFSIEVFGLFPVFRRHLRHQSWIGHLWLTTALVVLASGGLSMTISGGGWGMGVGGVVLGGIITSLSMGMTSWWLIGLQRYKNEIHGPWDPARPIIRRHWN